jgi:hypothetical protein
MDESLSKFIVNIVAVSFFISALGLFFFMDSKTNNLGNAVKDSFSKNTNVEEGIENAPESVDVCSGAYLIAKIKNGLEHSVIINDFVVMDVSDNLTFDYSVIDIYGKYKERYVYGEGGKILYLVYVSV